jgi:hypothetical protein
MSNSIPLFLVHLLLPLRTDSSYILHEVISVAATDSLVTESTAPFSDDSLSTNWSVHSMILSPSVQHDDAAHHDTEQSGSTPSTPTTVTYAFCIDH